MMLHQQSPRGLGVSYRRLVGWSSPPGGSFDTMRGDATLGRTADRFQNPGTCYHISAGVVALRDGRTLAGGKDR